MTKLTLGGNLGGHNATAEAPYRKRDYEKGDRGRPVVGQSKPYSGQNAHNVHQAKTKAPEPGSKSDKIPLGGPKTKS